MSTFRVWFHVDFFVYLATNGKRICGLVHTWQYSWASSVHHGSWPWFPLCPFSVHWGTGWLRRTWRGTSIQTDKTSVISICIWFTPIAPYTPFNIGYIVSATTDHIRYKKQLLPVEKQDWLSSPCEANVWIVSWLPAEIADKLFNRESLLDTGKRKFCCHF